VISKIAKKGGWKQTLASPQEREKNLFLPKKIFEMKKPFRSKHCLQTTNSMRQCLMPNPKQMLPTHTHTHTHTRKKTEERERARERERERGGGGAPGKKKKATTQDKKKTPMPGRRVTTSATKRRNKKRQGMGRGRETHCQQHP
jgi:hypothetical protein